MKVLSELVLHHGYTFWSVIAVYGLLLAGVSFYLIKFVKNTKDFFGASRQTPWWISGLSFFMTAFSASVFIANASITYTYGPISFLYFGLLGSVFIFGYFIFSRRWHRTGSATAIDFIRRRYSPKTAQFFVWACIPTRILDNASRLYVTAVLIEVLFDTGLPVSLLITAIITILYTIAGGFFAVVLTDAIQALVTGILVIIVGAASYLKAGGWAAIMKQLPEGYWSLNSADGQYDMLFIIMMVAVGIFTWNGYWSLVQRYVAVETESDAKKVSLTGAVAYYTLFPLMLLPPVFAVILVPGLTGVEQTEQCFVRLAQLILPAGLLGLFCFSIFGATVTSLNSELNVMSQVLIQDVFNKKLLRCTERTRLLIGRISIVVIMALCLVIAANVRTMGGAFHFLMTVLGMTGAPLYMPLLVGLLYRRTPSWGAILSFCLGLGVSLIMTFILRTSIGWMVLANMAVTALTMFMTGLFWPVKSPTVTHLFEQLKQPDSGNPAVLSASREFKGTMLNIVTICILIIGVVILATALTADAAAYRQLIYISAGLFILTSMILMLINQHLRKKNVAVSSMVKRSSQDNV